jgi:hypothetical protein
MLLSLPPELIELIVDQVARSSDGRPSLKSLSRVAKAWTHPCQQHLWAKVVFFTSQGSASHSKTRLLARRIRSHPHIGAHVRSLKYWAHTPDSGKRRNQREDIERVAGALTCMTNLVDVTLGYGWGNITLAFDECPASWQEAVARVIIAPSLQHLELHNISRIPFKLLERALGNLVGVALLGCQFKRQESQGTALGRYVFIAVSLHAHRATILRNFERSITALGGITCDSRSYRSLQRCLYPRSEVQPCGPELSSVGRLELTIDTPLDDCHLLRNLTKLTNLHLCCTFSASHPLYYNLILYDTKVIKSSAPDSEHPPFGAVLLQVHPSVYTSLTRLTVTAHQGISMSSTTDPLLGLCSEEILPKFSSLQTLHLELHFEFDNLIGHVPNASVELWFQSPSWGRLDAILSRPASFAKLQEVCIEIYLRRIASSSISERISSLLRRSSFTGLQRRDSEEEGFSFELNIPSLRYGI